MKAIKFNKNFLLTFVVGTQWDAQNSRDTTAALLVACFCKFVVVLIVLVTEIDVMFVHR